MLNYHHLRYFWAVAHDGNLSRTARRLRVAQSALSAQVRELEDQLGQPLFLRSGRRLELTEAGKLVLAMADPIFEAGEELWAVMRNGRGEQHELRVGAQGTLSRNFQRSFPSPLLDRPGTKLWLESGSLPQLLSALERHELDVVLSNQPAPAGGALQSRRLARQPVSVVASNPLPAFQFPVDLAHHPIILPGPGNELRVEFDALCARAGVVPNVVAEVDDMAMIRLLVRDSHALGLVPSVVVRDELRDGRVHELCSVPALADTFYAITYARRFPHPLLPELIQRDEEELLRA
jgi:LysR family transcriptional activator of nhaA